MNYEFFKRLFSKFGYYNLNSKMDNIKHYVQQNKERFIEELIELLKIPSVSADSAYSQDVINTAEAVKTAWKKPAANLWKFAKHRVIRLFSENTSSTQRYQRFWCTDITTYNRRIRWNYGRRHHLNR